ncbi:Carbonic anhydrase [Patulibacter medicamentivorans]|jgi:carbonic anhydrase|uniref:carbonic anhydrase n=1 Tax=Patulibacter medicamentivorans TaxID=1097667 RepID=H0E8X5_9ACTN|nr:carbonic anhydrase [Patulibacter medicamentivorans]EHN09875.1 Carbonic anhydrase [Patulibacter medicamentivorans]
MTDEPHDPQAPDLIRHAEGFADRYTPYDTPRPRRHVAVVSCMDARLDLFGLFGLDIGDAHLIRNAGGVVTDDVIRSLAISQRKLGTREVLLVHHTQCGQLTYTDDDLRNELLLETGYKPAWTPESFKDLDEDLRQSMRRVLASPFLLYPELVRGFVFEVESGRLREIRIPEQD